MMINIGRFVTEPEGLCDKCTEQWHTREIIRINAEDRKQRSAWFQFKKGLFGESSADARQLSDKPQQTKLTRLEAYIIGGILGAALIIFIWTDIIRPLIK